MKRLMKNPLKMLSLVKILVVIMMIMKLTKRSTCFPVNLRVIGTDEKDGVKTTISNMADQRHLLNHTVPLALLSNLSPPNYLQKQGLNVTTDKPTNFLSILLSTRKYSYHSSQLNTVSRCPIQWAVDFEANRIPTTIQKAVCNLHGTTCLTQDGRPSCEELRVEWKIQRFLGLTSNGDQVWQQQFQSFPVACSCAGL